jgi:urease accessory protein
MATTFTHRLPPDPSTPVSFTLSLTSEERTRSRHRFETADGQVVFLQLPRGTVLRDGDVLQSEAGQRVRIAAQLEPVLTVQATTPLQLLQAAYHLGNRHVPLEVTDTYLRFAPDPVLREMLEHRGLQVVEDVQPFQPELGAYGHSH